MKDKYSSFSELQRWEKEGSDYRIISRPGQYPVAIMAPHGGTIEPFTSEIADAIAGKEFAYYSFTGIKQVNVRDLHLTSHNFDEPTALDLAARSEMVLTVHGLKDRNNKFLMVGGLNEQMIEALTEALQQEKFKINEPEAKYAGKNRENICNRGRNRAGVQLELSYALRESIVNNENIKSSFVTALRTVLFEHMQLNCCQGGDSGRSSTG